MKTKIFFAICLISALALPLTAQESGSSEKKGESPFYYQTVPIQKIYVTNEGYVVAYNRTYKAPAFAYIPVTWFAAGEVKGDMVLLNAKEGWPRMDVYYKDGAFDHVRLFIREQSHETWGNLPYGTELKSRFEGVESLKIEY
jgi:hypothetical protein